MVYFSLMQHRIFPFWWFAEAYAPIWLQVRVCFGTNSLAFKLFYTVLASFNRT